MKLKKLKKLKVNSYEFDVIWDKSTSGASFDYGDKKIVIGVRNKSEEYIFHLLIHELQEICAVEMNVRLHRPDCDSDYIFVYDHRQHETMSNMLASLLAQFIT